jgi:exo-beta-1,3-glucanase (GH17 family)
MPDVDLVSVAIGNEVDAHLSDQTADAYAVFFERAREAIHAIRPDVPVTMKMTWAGLRDRPALRAVALRGDALSITWYPMDDAFRFADPDVALAELTDMAAMADGPWELSEVGYPSNGCGASSLQLQARFHAALSAATAQQPDLQLVQRVWSHDISAAEVAAYAVYYKTNERCFTSFLASLGLRTARDEPKPAFEALMDQYEWARSKSRPM